MKTNCTEGSPEFLKVQLIRAILSGAEKQSDGILLNGNVCSDFPQDLFSPNAICLYLYAKNFQQGNKLCTDPTTVKWLLWDHSHLSPAVHNYVFSRKHAKGASSSEDLSNLNNALLLLQKAMVAKNEKLPICLNEAAGDGSPTILDIVLWSSLLPVLHFVTSQSTFETLQKWESNLCSKCPIFNLFKSTTDLQKVEEWIIKTGETRRILEPNGSPSAADSSQKKTGTLDESRDVTSNWLQETPQSKSRPQRKVPVLPKERCRNVLITSALPYVNNVPHLGNIIGCVLSADVYSRYCRSVGYNSLFICGTDEYGTATENKALEEGVTPKEICDKYYKVHKEVYEWFNISFDYFGRTTTEYQTKISQDIFWKLDANGCLLEESVEQLKCDSCDRFLADRFVEGTCPYCGYDDARGDQCDACTKLVDATKLINPRCKVCSARPKLVTSNHIFLNLPLFEEPLSQALDGLIKTGVWTESATNITNAWLRDGLKPRCITRDLKWGTPVPKKNFTDKVFYVWFDAPIGYMSITANYCGEHWQKWWKNDKMVEIFNFMAKDNVPFHSVMFPAILMGAKDNYGLVNSLVATQYLNYEDGKFSKSRNVGVFGNNAQDSGISSDIFRFYLLFVRPESQDTTFSWADFAMKSNTELLNNLGNFVNRALTFCFNNYSGHVQKISVLEDAEKDLINKIDAELKTFVELMEKVKLKDALTKILNISRLGNGYIQSCQPWVLMKSKNPEDKEKAGAINALTVNVVHLCAVMLEPYMPATAKEIFYQLNLYQGADDQNGMPSLPGQFMPAIAEGHKINKPKPLFRKLEDDEVTKLKDMYGGAASKASTENKPNAPASSLPTDPEQLQKMVTEQGNKIRELKAQKPQNKELIGQEVAVLKELKAALEKALAQAASAVPVVSGDAPPSNTLPSDIDQLQKMVTDQGNKVRELKAQKPQNKELIGKEVAVLKELKAALEKAHAQIPKSAPVELPAAKVVNVESPAESAPFSADKQGTAKKSPHEAGKSAKKVESVVPSKPAEVKTEDPPAPKAAPAPVSPREEQKAAPEPKTPEASTRTSTSGSVSSSGGSSATPGSGKKRNRKGKKK